MRRGDGVVAARAEARALPARYKRLEWLDLREGLAPGERLSVRREGADADTLLALRLNGEPLHLDHGFPVRLIGPNRPGVMQTKWVGRLVVS